MTLFSSFVILFLYFVLVYCQTVVYNPWDTEAPAVAFDYKVNIDPGKEDCYFQYVNPGATFYVAFGVIRGGDGMAGFAVRNPAGVIVHPYQWKDRSDYQEVSQTGGYYSVCIDNQFSRFASKLVALYLTVVRYDQWELYKKEVEDLDLGVDNFTSRVMTVEQNINEMMQYQHRSRDRENRDMATVDDSFKYVQRWSLLQIFVIISVTIVQVYFVRKLFDIKSSRPRV